MGTITKDHKNHTIKTIPHGTAFSVQISGPLLNSRAGTFSTEEDAMSYAVGRVDEAKVDE